MKISITGEIVNQQWEGCFSPKDLKDLLADVDENEPLEVEITSPGGDVFSGIQIANILSRRKGQVITHAVGFCASIATVILMAGKKVVVDSNCFTMWHNPWTFVEGNANDLEKEIDTLNKCKEAMMGFYRKHSKIGDDELSRMLDDETWLLGEEVKNYFDVDILENDEQLNLAAKYDLSKFKNIPRGLMNMSNKAELEKEEEEKKVEETVEEPVKEEETVEEPSKEETQEEETTKAEEEEKEEPVEEEEEKKEEKTLEELEKEIEELKQENDSLKSRVAELEKEEEETTEEKAMFTKAECDKRVSGIQSSLGKQIQDFKNQLKDKEEELISAKADITRLNQTLETTSKELSEMTSALEEKTKALEMLNSNVNAKAEELPTMEEGLNKCQSPAEKVAFLKSGKYIR